MKKTCPERSRRIVFIGGHHNSALVVAKALRKKGYQIHWFGHKHTMSGEKSLSLEFQEVTQAGFPFIELRTGKFYRTYNPFQFLKIFYGLIQSFFLLLKMKPQLIVSFGGYLSFPVVVAGFLVRIKIILHEQTSRAGLANRLLAPLAEKIILTWPSSKKFFPQKKIKVIGLPLSAYLFDKKKPTSPFKEKLPIVLITGGKQGSHIINKKIEQNLENWLRRFNLIHQTGGTLKTGDYERLVVKKKALAKKQQSHYLIKKFFYGKEMIDVVELADLLISRSGAHIVYELAALGKPAILIPLPWAYNNEQMVNAQILAERGGAMILTQRRLTPASLDQKLNYLINNLREFKNKAGRAKELVNHKATAQMVAIIEEIIK